MNPLPNREAGEPSRLSREEAIERLARELNWKQEHLDPSNEGDWGDLSECDKEFFRTCVEWLICFPDLINAALSNESVSQR